MSLITYYAGPIAHATDKSKAISKPAIAMLKKHGEVKTEHIGWDNVLEWEEKQQAIGVNVCERDLEWLNDCDAVVADITWGSVGVGFEIAYALMVRKIPTLAVWQPRFDEKGKPIPASRMITQCIHPLLSKAEYTDESSLEHHINSFMSRVKPSHTLYPCYAVFDSIDGAGKGMIYEALRDWAKESTLPAFDLLEYMHSHKTELFPPSLDEVLELVPGCRMILAAQPTYIGMGELIRNKQCGIICSSNKLPYTAEATAHAYALDRDIIFKRLIKDALAEGWFVAQERGIVTSEHYQPVQAEGDGFGRELFLGLVRGLPGNQQELNHAPGLMMLAQTPVDVAMSRLDGREKKDNARFETRTFQSRIAEIYAGNRIRQSYARRGTRVVDLEIPAAWTPEDTKRAAQEIWEKYLAEKCVAY